MPLPTNDEIVQHLDLAVEELSKAQPLFDALRPTPGPHALFHHLAHAAERVGDVKVILGRMLDGRAILSRLSKDIRLDRPDPDLMRLKQQTVQAMKLDYESLFHFGSVLLDQWSHATGYLAGVDEPESFGFHHLVVALDRKAPARVLVPLRLRLLSQARWLHFWMRTYRNKFVVHANRPWQRGSVFKVTGDDFCLFTPSPPGWEDDEKLWVELRDLGPLAPEWLKRAERHRSDHLRPLAFLARVVDNIGTVDDQASRDRVASIVGRAGIGTPTFQIVAAALAELVSQGTPLVRDAALEQPHLIKLGSATV